LKRGHEQKGEKAKQKRLKKGWEVPEFAVVGKEKSRRCNLKRK